MFRYRLARAVFKLIQILLTQLEVSGRENIPLQGPYIVTVNHMSAADTPLMLVAFPPLHWRFFAGEKWQDHWLWGPLMGWLGAIYINRGAVDRHALKEAMAAIDEGYVFGTAPEGTRSKDGEMKPAKDGAAYLASRGQVSILPVALINTDILFAEVKQFRRPTVKLHIGEPYTLPDLGRRVRSRDLPAYTHLIMIEIAALLPERYHGYYKDSPALKALLRGEDPWPYCQQQ
ncbi:MAG: lysophospholipid acyltransferase family protein [Candidatus Promineifilaceae bacterium]|nr:lysophospholipid acyltransferase family protein [Candidatus Promineifilaceae bacterium]